LHDDFLALLEHVRDQLRAARLDAVASVGVATLPVMRAASAVIAAPAIAPASTACGMLHARAKIIAHARRKRLWFTGRLAAVFGVQRGFRRQRVGVGMFAFLGRGDHSFFFGFRFRRFQFRIIRSRETSVALIASGFIALRFGNLLGKRNDFLFGQAVGVRFVVSEFGVMQFRLIQFIQRLHRVRFEKFRRFERIEMRRRAGKFM
jgi:hypothetical protein